MNSNVHIIYYYINKYICALSLDIRKKGDTTLKRLVSIVRSKNKKKILFSNGQLKLQNQESPKVQEVTGNATTSKLNDSNASLVNYDTSSSDSDT